MNKSVVFKSTCLAVLTIISSVLATDILSCPTGWDLYDLHCYKFFNIKSSWEKSAELCERYGAALVTIDSYIENNITSNIISKSYLSKRKPEKYWLGLTTLDDLRTNTLESSTGSLISQYSGYWDLNQPNPQAGECVLANPVFNQVQTWELTSCENLLPFMCRTNACPQNSFHCANGNCIHQNFKCDNGNDCGDNSDEIDCPANCNFHMQSGGDVIESPNYPHKYNMLSQCKWTLEGPLGSNIILQFQDFETEKSYDSVQILTGGRTEEKSIILASISGKIDLTMKPFVTASNFMIIKFSTDGSVERKGFRATWKTETKTCGNNLQAASQGQILTSPNYPNNYPGGIECLYVITAELGKVISIEIQDLDINSQEDYLLIRDGGTADNRPIARFSGSNDNNSKVVISTGNKLYLYFNTKYGNTGRGFSLRYGEGCKVVITANNGSISSPSFGLENYPTNQECIYNIKNALGTALSLKFDKFNIHKSDFVEVYDGLSINGLKLHSGNGFTGSNVPKLTLTASSGEMLIKFSSDSLNNGPGWSAIFSADCPALKPGLGAIASNLDTAFGTVVTFTCPLGQEFATGKNKIVSECVSGGFWNIDYIPNCQEVYCGPVPQIDNGFSIGSTNVTYRGIAMYQCYAGFTFLTNSPVEKISCLSDGKWEKKPACVASQCSSLPEVPHSNITILNGGGRGYGTIVQFECNHGYERSGLPVLICSGNWSGEVPKCIRKKCRKLPHIPNGFIVDKTKHYSYGDEARVQCFKGYKLNGSNIIRCNSDQTFSNIPTCVDVNECSTTQCDLTTTKCMNTDGSFYCECRSGFSSTTECHRIGDLGLSNGGLPDDSIITSSSEDGYTPEMVRLNSMGWCGSSLESGNNWITIDFKAPIILKGFRTMSVQRFDESIAFSSAVRLQYTSNLTDIFKDYTNPDGTAVEFRILEPTLSILNLPMPIEARYVKFKIQDFVGAPCIRLETMGCNRLDCIDNNECSTNNGWCDQKCVNSPGSYACSCNNGYQLFTSNGTAGFHIANFESGKREGDILLLNKTCVPVMCPSLSAPKNGILLSSKLKFNYGDVISFQCNFGYIMSGSPSISCLASGNWNASVPECNYAKCVSLPNDKNEGLIVLRANMDIPLVSFKENVTLTCNTSGRHLRGSITSNIRQCVFDPRLGYPDYWLSGVAPSCLRTDCGPPIPTPGAEYGQYVDTKYQSSFFFGCQNTYKLAGQTSKHDNVVRCQGNSVWDFGDLRCEGPVCKDPGRPSDGAQVSQSYEQGSEIHFTCQRPGYILINPRPISCIREPECEIIRPLGITSGKIPDSAINATSERPNYEAKHIRLNSVTGWCGKQEAFTYVSVDMGQVYRIKAILVKGVVTNDIVGRPTEIRFFYKQSENENYVVYFPNFNLTMRDPGNYGELAMITLPKYVQARYVILGIVSYMDNACLKFELMGCEEPKSEPLLGYDYGYSPCVDNEPPVFHNCPQQAIVVRRRENGELLPVNFTVPTATDNSGSIARLEVKPQDFTVPSYIFKSSVLKYIAYDYDGNVAICEINITVPDVTPPLLNCPQSYVIELVDKVTNYEVNFNETMSRIKTFDSSGEVKLSFIPPKANIPIGGYKNISVIATDKFNNEASCYFQVTVQATPCVDWELQAPENGNIDCHPDDNGLKCRATCKPGFRFTDGDVEKVYSCQTSRLWKPTAAIPDCVSENTQQADYIVTASVLYRANGVVAQNCLSQYQDFLSLFYNNLNQLLSNRCSAVAVNMNVSFVNAIPTLIEENVLQVDFIMSILPAVKQPKLYDLCGSTLNLIFDLSVPDTSVVIEPLLVVPIIANQCPPLRALKSSISRGFSCNTGEVLNMDTTDVPRCLHCPAGTYATTGQSICTPCPKGYYQNRDRQGSCLACPLGTYTKDQGSKSVSSCLAVCGYGTYSPTGMVPCLECPRNSFSGSPPLGGFKDCQACPANTYTFQPSASNSDLCRGKCSPGSYSATGLQPCYTCPQNFYQSVEGSQTCNECPSNMKTEGIGATGREDCKLISCNENSCNHGGLCLAMGHSSQCFCPAGFSGSRCEIDIDECASQPCYNGGRCIDMPQSYRCECLPGYTGINCQEEISDCKNDTCPTRAMCKNEPGIGNYTCLCRSGYTGNNCDITIDPCSSPSNPCQNEASCSALKQGRYKCNCLPGWEGIHCENNINDCDENPCLLGANCTDLVNDFSCSCPNGFTGKRCEEKIDLCLSEPCKHGSCIDKFFHHECICDEGWSGLSCDQNINDCESTTCMNNSTCVDLVNDYLCQCELGFTGKRCQHTIDDCESRPCQNGATCFDQIDGFTCKCRPGYVGLQCEAEIDECLTNPCNPIGSEQCIDKDNAYQCVCRNGFTGTYCETDIDDCENEPCLNNGICRDKIGGFECICADGWSGIHCERKINVCERQKPCQNSAKCIDLFQDYFCACLSGTDGKNCETAPERCIGSPCMHDGKCQDFGSGLNCSCSEDYTGIGCQYEFDACEAGVCKNGATCIDNGLGYTCICPNGFTGKNCEKDIVDCNENSCPPGSTCVDLINSFYCQCPFNMTGEDCRKPVQIDYDLQFNDPRLSTASQIIPFLSKNATSLTIAMWVQFSQKDNSGIFFTLYEVDSPHIANKRRILLQIHSSGVQISIFSDMQDVFLSFKEYTTINDGQWHHIAIVWDGLQGQLQLITEGLIASKTEYVSGRILPKYLWVVLGKPQPDNFKSGISYADVGFQGKITKAQIWSRALDIISEVQKQVRDCRNEPVLFDELLLNWAGYDNITGIERSVPSLCGKKKCPYGFTGPSCQQIVVDKEKPKIEFCPGDLWVIAKNGSAVVTWDNPQFSDNVGVISVTERNGHRSGQTLSWGTYEITYVASDVSGNSEICSFTISVLNEFCPSLNDPVGGTQVCKDWGAGGQFKACEISCNPGFKFSEPIPQFYTCGSEGFWRPTSDPSAPFIYPSCSSYTPAQRVFKVEMLFPSDVLCNKAGQSVLRQKVFSSMNSLNRDWNICSKNVEGSMECQNLEINVNCEHIRSNKKYIKREVISSSQNMSLRFGRQQSGDTYSLEISFPANADPVVQQHTGERSTIKKLLEKLILVDNQLSVHDILPNTILEPSSIILKSEYTCPAGQVVMEPDCVSCSIGTYFDTNKKTCVPCEKGTYQSESGQLQCSKCPIIAGRVGVTVGTGSRTASDCKERCPSGKFFDAQSGLCKACGYGFYQPNEGSFSCKLCDLGQTTRSTEATSKKECKDECESGMQLGVDGKCEMCPKGTFRLKGIYAACVDCPLGRTTLNIGSTTIEDCSLPICKPGTYLNTSTNICDNCKKGFYQPEFQSVSCIACPPNHSTRDMGATSKSDCSNPCENVTNDEERCDLNAYCILVPETSEFNCECKPGFNGTGYKCKDVCDGFCENSGACVKDLKGKPSCRCIGSFTGPHCVEKSEFAYIAGGIAAAVVFIIIIVLLIWMICVRSNKRRDPKKVLTPAIDQTGSQVNFYYGAHTPYAESIAPSHHSTYAHYYDDEEDGWEMPNFYNETYMKDGLHSGKMSTLARSNASLYGTKEDLYDRLKRHAYPGKKEKSDSDSEVQ